jgi:head-tail adaptor
MPAWRRRSGTAFFGLLIQEWTDTCVVRARVRSRSDANRYVAGSLHVITTS